MPSIRFRKDSHQHCRERTEERPLRNYLLPFALDLQFPPQIYEDLKPLCGWISKLSLTGNRIYSTLCLFL